MVRRLFARFSLLHVFVLTSALILGLGGYVLGTVVTSSIRGQAVEDAKASLAQYVDGVLVNQLVEGGSVQVRQTIPASERRELENREDILNVKVWRKDGVLAWTSQGADRIGERFPVEGHLKEALEGEGEGELESLHGDEHQGELARGIDRALEIYVPLRARDGGRVIGAYEVYSDSAQLESTMSDRVRDIRLVIALVFLSLVLALGVLARGASNTLRTQTKLIRERSAALAESYEALEQNTVETIETLNATVEAKDPYTAGHSLSVQSVALAIGRELRLPADAIEALRWAGLFHDIGKIGIPDAILLKPAALSDAEYEHMKEHPVTGARIVARLRHLQPAVPAILHHHERWDGRGYPDGLSGKSIPRLAAIVGLADAWDAMTTDRPYAVGLSAAAALDEVARGRGSQFAPDIVDAFMRAYVAGDIAAPRTPEPELLPA